MRRPTSAFRLLLAAVWLATGAEVHAENACNDGAPPALPTIVATTPPSRIGEPTEIVIALPKNEDGSLRTEGLELGGGARIVSSRWSPLLCATLAVVVGPADVAIDEWIPRRPEGAVVVENTRYYTAATDDAPRASADPYRPLQHGLEWVGVDDARSVTEGQGVSIAVLDSAPDLSHPELTRVRQVEADGLPDMPTATHGTLVTGVIAATRGNAIGIQGVAPEATVLAVPVCRPAEEPGSADLCVLYDMLAGLDAAFAAGAQVMNLSLVGPPNPLLQRATLRLDELGVLIVAAAGNEGTDAPRYPAAYPSVIGVGAVDADGALWKRSNRGASAEIHAPGVEIVTTTTGAGFAFADGTSLATAHVSGVLALLLSAEPVPANARSALFRSGHASSRATRDRADLAPVCDGLALLGQPCGGLAAAP